MVGVDKKNVLGNIYGVYKYSKPVQLKYLPLLPSNHKTGAPIPTFAPFQHHQSRPSEKQFIFNKSRETRKKLIPLLLMHLIA